LQTVKVPLAVVDAILTVPANFISKAGNPQTVSNKLKQQREEIDQLHQQLMAHAADRPEETTYRPKCKGRTGLLNGR
jgi:hypothetical protein